MGRSSAEGQLTLPSPPNSRMRRRVNKEIGLRHEIDVSGYITFLDRRKTCVRHSGHAPYVC